MTFTVPDTIPAPPTEPSYYEQPVELDVDEASPAVRTTKPARPDRNAYAAELAAAVVEAEKELARDQKALDKAKAEVERLEDWVAFDLGRIESRTKSRDHFDRLQAKAAK